MTREELAALFADLIGLRLRPIEVDTLLQAVDKYVEDVRGRWYMEGLDRGLTGSDW